MEYVVGVRAIPGKRSRLGITAAHNIIFAHLMDIDNDGDLDLLTSIPTVLLFLNDGSGNFVERSFPSGLPGAYSVGDYDNDGFVDIWFERAGEKVQTRKLMLLRQSHHQD